MRYSNTGKIKENGVVYTPSTMANYLAAEILKHRTVPFEETVRILDPAIGGGELIIALISAIKKAAPTIKIIAVGYETDSSVCADTASRLQSQYENVVVEIKNEDFLQSVENKTTGLFDFVIANPPYIRTQIMGSERAQQLAEKLSLGGRVDIYYAFLVYTKDVLENGGVAGYITSNKFLTIKSGASVRNFILSNYQLHQITDLGDTKLFDASVLPCILIFSRGITDDRNAVKFTSVYETSINKPLRHIDNIFDAIYDSGCYELADGRKYIFQQGTIQSVEKDDLWNLLSSDIQLWLARVEAKTWKRFSDIGKIRVGIKTTADNVFIGNNWANENAEIELLRPLITHRNAGQYIANEREQWQVLYTHTVMDGKRKAIEIDDYPLSKKYLLQHQEQLSGRTYIAKANRNWYEIWVPQNPESWAHRKIVFRDISEEPQFWLDETGAVVNGDCYWIDVFPDVSEDILYLALAIANSRFIERYYDTKFNTKLYSGKRRYMSQYVEQFPIPSCDTHIAKKAISIVHEIVTCNNQAIIAKRKMVLDSLVEEMFN